MNRETTLIIITLLVFSIKIYGQQESKPSCKINYEIQVNYLKQTEDFDEFLWNKTLEIFERTLIIDCHLHQPFRIDQRPKQVTYSYLNSNKIGIVRGFPLRRESSESISERIMADIINFKKEIIDSAFNIQLVKNPDDFAAAVSSHQIPILIHLESFEGLAEGEVSNLQKYYNEGVRMIGFNQSGLDTVWLNDKLTRYGIDFIKELTRLGLICDITHIRRTIQNQVIELTDVPVIISHGGAFGAVNSVFNTPDSLLIKMTSKGGMIGVSFFSGQISTNVLSEINSGVEWDKTGRAAIEELIDHIDYLKKLVGIDHIGIGSDYGGSGSMSPTGLETIEGFPLIIYHLLKRGYSEEEIEKVLGLNYISFFKRIEAKAY
ncbi:MAG: dipeptidase [Bacteroidetes bacterium]|nr:dipeptidase [Bacteroidota bacterium]